MASSSNRKSGSSARSTKRKRVVLGAKETVRVDYAKGQPKVDTERRRPQQRAPKKPDSAGSRLATSKRQERERRQIQLRNRRLAVWAGLIAVVFLVIWGAFSIVNAPWLRVSSVEVVGAKRLSASEVTSRAAIGATTTMLSLSPGKVERRLLADPWIVSAEVSRRFPRTVVLTVQERVPVAVVDAGGAKLWLASKDGRWLGQRSEDTSGAYITVRDVPDLKPVAGKGVESTEALNALRVIDGLSPELRKLVITVSAPTVEKTALITKGDIEIFIGSAADIRTKDQLALRILKEQAGKVVYINVRSIERPTWRGLESAP